MKVPPSSVRVAAVNRPRIMARCRSAASTSTGRCGRRSRMRWWMSASVHLRALFTPAASFLPTGLGADHFAREALLAGTGGPVRAGDHRDALLPPLGHLGRQMQGRNVGVVTFDVGPEQPDEVVDERDQ